MNRKAIQGILAGSCFLAVLALAGRTRAQDDHYPQFMDMGNRAYQTQKYDLAVEYYLAALDDNPKCWQADVGLGNCRYYQKKLPQALKAYEAALQINPENPELARFIAFLRSQIGGGAVPTPTPVPAAPLPTLPPLPGYSR
jgi:tetratricopeptide (TPR) repeat protein